jgi:hypothetical protein
VLRSPTAQPTLIKKENQIFLIYKEILSGAVANSYTRKGFLILYVRKCAIISPYMYEEAELLHSDFPYI